MVPYRAWWLFVVVIGAAACEPATPPPPLSPQPVQVAAASDLQGAFEDLGRAFEQRSHVPVRFTFGASGLLARQVKEGAPFDVFAAANAAFVDGVIAAGVCDTASRVPYARGHLVLWSRADTAIAPPHTLADLGDPRFSHIAVANPETAPYGAAAREALTRAGLWPRVQARLVYGDNVRHAWQLAHSGNADVAFVSRSVAHDAAPGTVVDVDESLYTPLEQVMAACSRGPNAQAGRAFAAFVASAEGRAILLRHGFGVPGEATRVVQP